MSSLDRTVDVFLEPRHVEARARLAEFVAAEIAPLAPPEDDAAARTQARDVLGRLGRAGWFAAIEARDYRQCCLTREALAAASPLADAVFALQALGSTPVFRFGSEELVEEYARPATRGEKMAAFAMTEPDAGSDVASLATTARRDGDHWVLDGRKMFISNAGVADFYVTFAKTDPAAGAKGISAFVVPANRVRFVRAQVMSEPHPLGEIAFEGARVPESHLVGAEGGGLKVGLATLDGLRATVAAAACGMARRALDESLAWARHRKQFGRPLAEHQLVQHRLARMAMDLEASRLLTYRAAAAKDGGQERVTLESSMAKAYATEAAQRVVDDAIQIHGGRGVMADHPVDRLYRAVRALRIYEGTTEIQHLVIAGHLLAEGSDA
ncbi:MAG: acyl-CoA dehydrogenase family protein [Gemmatimonadetes bacterium]|nr:acyl-CoA dehydrogenase family protein [Gemmatimonadota bacterium]